MGKLRSLLKLKKYLIKYKGLFALSMVSILVGSFIAIPIPYITGKIVDNVFANSKKISQLLVYIIILAIFYVGKNLISISTNYLSSKFSNQISNDLKYELVDKILNLPMDYLGNIEKGYLQGRISECNAITATLSVNVVGTIVNCLDVILSIATMFVISPRLSVIVFMIIPLFFLVVKMANKGFTQISKAGLEANANLNAECFDIINGIEDIKLLSGKMSSLNKFKNKLNYLVKITLMQRKKMITLTQSIAGVNDLGTLIILLASGILIIKGEFTIGLYTTFTLYCSKIFASTQQLANVKPALKQTCLSVERIYEFLDMEDENSGKVKCIAGSIDRIRFENLTFKYKSNEANILENFNMDIKKGEKVLITGENGSGKSTIIKLLEGLYKPQYGRILFNEDDLSTLNLDILREKIGIVSQKIFLFKGTVLDNILYGQDKKERKDVEELINQLQLQDYMSKLPKGLDTPILDINSGVSGGQMQVIAFVRAILQKKDVIILDESISNVDIETRKIVLDILRNYNKECILIIVSHLTEGMDFINKTIHIKGDVVK